MISLTFIAMAVSAVLVSLSAIVAFALHEQRPEEQDMWFDLAGTGETSSRSFPLLATRAPPALPWAAQQPRRRGRDDITASVANDRRVRF